MVDKKFAINGTDYVVYQPEKLPKPQIDIVRYSMANAEDLMDLDAILSELLELENQLSSDASDHLIFGHPTLSKSQNSNATTAFPNSKKNTKQDSIEYCSPSDSTCFSTCKFQSSTTSLSHRVTQTLESCASPDTDSAFGDSSSTEYSLGSVNGLLNVQNRCTNYDISTLDNHQNLLNSTVSQINVKKEKTNSLNNSSSGFSQLSIVDMKAQKIKEALEKMKEAKMKKIYIKIFLENEKTKGILIDERWTVAETMRQLAEKLNIMLTAEHAIVEEYPDLLIKRIYEDHEFVVENIEDWMADSKNKLYFLYIPDKYNFIQNPQHFFYNENLLNNGNFLNLLKQASQTPTNINNWSTEAKNTLLKSVLNENDNNETDNLLACCSNTNFNSNLNIEGFLMLKVDGKKVWKKHYFVLRSSGLYYNPKTGKQKYNIKELQCLMNVYNNQIYTCLDWKKKYKAPTEYGFAIKHPRIQVKRSKYIKYICAEDSLTFTKWITALRLTRNGINTLHKNYVNAVNFAKMSSNTLNQINSPICVNVPNISMERLSILDSTLTKSIITLNSKKFKEPNYTTTNQIKLMNDEKQSLSSNKKCDNTVNNNFKINFRDANIAFDKDECGTIKKQPLSLENNNVENNNSTNIVGISKQTEDYDSDEDDEQFPPPPLSQALLTQNNVPLCYNNVEIINNAKNQTTIKKITPPPPPKRSLTTSLQNVQSSVDMFNHNKNLTENTLIAELKNATACQRQRIEGS